MLDVIAGYDPEDPSTAKGVEHIPDSYTDYLNPTGLDGARIGILRTVFSSGPESDPVVEVAEEAIGDLKALGAKTIEVDAEIDVDELIDSFYVGNFEQQERFNEYLDSLGSGAPIETFEDFVEADEYHESLESGLQAALEIESPTDEPEYFKRLYRRNQFIERLYDIMAADELDAFFFPHQKQLVAEIGDDQ
ncbi:amidase [Halalkalicoccus jeotgali B3]|uniref:Amidase n=2 Tax=Halalkalicoccus jeotgali TaxID=413810 RepID=D8JCE2_HALJB|nr:amidase [Halalkalicoccus jeotgali B3]ELY38785.1 amidase [Halalkalicoccus jeotgali B3]